ncbi:hypothetical protein [Parasutterella excrementihominis]|uniref:hypothetical protein n=1 Tax=Parasutterella excrementihominis TaxID=487175 RepID=UPI003AB4B748
MNSQKLAETLQSFNEMGSAGKNEDLGRNPKSLKALEGHVFMPFIFCAGVSKTIGGLKANGEHQALDWCQTTSLSTPQTTRIQTQG